MSWSIHKCGKREAVREAIALDRTIPEPIKICVLSCLGEEPNTPNGVRVEGYGHIYAGENSYFSNISKLEVIPVELTG